MLAASKAALAQDRTQLQGQIGELQARLEAVSRKFRGIESDAAVIEGEVSDLVCFTRPPIIPTFPRLWLGILRI